MNKYIKIINTKYGKALKLNKYKYNNKIIYVNITNDINLNDAIKLIDLKIKKMWYNILKCDTIY